MRQQQLLGMDVRWRTVSCVLYPEAPRNFPLLWFLSGAKEQEQMKSVLQTSPGREASHPCGVPRDGHISQKQRSSWLLDDFLWNWHRNTLTQVSPAGEDSPSLFRPQGLTNFCPAMWDGPWQPCPGLVQWPFSGSHNPFMLHRADVRSCLARQLQLSVGPSMACSVASSHFLPALPSIISPATTVSFLKTEKVMSLTILAETSFKTVGKIIHVAYKEVQEKVLASLSTLVINWSCCCSLPSHHTSQFPQDSMVPPSQGPLHVLHC